MKYINVKDLTDEQYEDLSNLINDRLTIEDETGLEVEYDVTDLKVDENNEVYAPTSAKVRTEYSNSGDDIPGGRSEVSTELTGYESIYTIIKNQ